ncbi:scm-like with four MBT domains protein 2 [Scyliorhinus canicula]|uniref:scm-like with four MBT domains protein 2 n=1 Tax=Scyliorhinus canicula TaxID=7830 RepID=UPI0018F42B09|nr:scm-like with four MBT domains protein 2 [Scyliorhinus canicula]XP_038667817.1 scm-like with four MBT domains protein 2 [Scyliorhinus canicula]XP_038667818.1 scm-like with four MBT domains protein 2 [Scyliorhinus canicula]XP_038667819.1 scm-like with four MBT domains protein 2 [Scyliorhinus canicula]
MVECSKQALLSLEPESRKPLISSMQEPTTLKTQSSANLNGEQYGSDVGSGGEDVDFNWDDYLEETGASPAPHNSFKHVEISLQSSFQPGMKLEVANKSNPDTYWVATIITTCGQLLLLRYSGYGDDRRADFWCDVMTANLHPVGWCSQNKKGLRPPKAICEKHGDWTEFLIQDLTGARTAPANLLEGPLRGKNTVDLVTPKSLIELQDSKNPFQYWVVRVIENVGGRLCLRYEGLNDVDKHDQWLFYLDCRLRPVGWCQENGCKLDPPTDIQLLKNNTEWKDALEKALSEAESFSLPLEVFKDQPDVRDHCFTAGMKLEAVDPREPFSICPATVTKVFNDQYFMITIDDLRPEASENSLLCHADSPGILPVQWCLKNGVHLTPPKGYPGLDFDWADYLKHCGAEALSQYCFRNTSLNRGFTKNMKLEAVNLSHLAEVCVASITKVKGRLMWLQLEDCKKSIPEYIVDVESMDIFPVGWCEANRYPLTPPYRAVCQKQKKVAVVQPEKQLNSTPVEPVPHDSCPIATEAGTTNGKYCCSKIYFNHRCFSGPYLNKGRIAELPQSVGPGKCVLVLKEVLTLLINAAYKPGRVLRELQLEDDPEWNCQEETLKAKYKGKTYRAIMKIVRTADRVADFCRRTCMKLECCPNLFGPLMVTDKCPENCSVHTKTKYTYYYGKKKKIIRPPVGHSNIENNNKKPARRRKKRRSCFVQKKKRSSTSVDYVAQENGDDKDYGQDMIDDETGSDGTSSEQRDDQTDTSFEMPDVKPKRLRRLRSASELPSPHVVDRAKRKRRAGTSSLSEDDKYDSLKCSAPKEIRQSEEDKLVLENNPLEWSVAEVVRFIKSTDCAPLAKIFQEQDIDGQALLLLTLPTVQECMELKLGPAIKLCHHIERVKIAFYAQYAN